MSESYNDRYQRENVRRIVVKVNKRTNPDIADHIDKIENVNAYILGLIRKDMTAAN